MRRSGSRSAAEVEFRTMDGIVARVTDAERALLTMMGLFAAAALTLACLGIYGLMAYSVSARAKEIGIRMALGASSSTVLRVFVQEGAKVIVAGLALGLLGAFAASRALESYLWGVEPFDPLSFAATAAVLAAVALLAVLAPALRATLVQPGRVLRGE